MLNQKLYYLALPPVPQLYFGGLWKPVCQNMTVNGKGQVFTLWRFLKEKIPWGRYLNRDPIFSMSGFFLHLTG